MASIPDAGHLFEKDDGIDGPSTFGDYTEAGFSIPTDTLITFCEEAETPAIEAPAGLKPFFRSLL